MLLFERKICNQDVVAMNLNAIVVYQEVINPEHFSAVIVTILKGGATKTRDVNCK